MLAEKPEECLHLFENAGMGTTAFFITEARSFAWWLLEVFPDATVIHIHRHPCAAIPSVCSLAALGPGAFL